MLNHAVLLTRLSPFCCFKPTVWILSLLWTNFTFVRGLIFIMYFVFHVISEPVYGCG